MTLKDFAELEVPFTKLSQAKKDALMQLVDTFDSLFTSEKDVHAISDLFGKLVKKELLSPLTNNAEEWEILKVKEDGQPILLQNKRYPSVYGDGTGAYWDDAAVLYEAPDGSMLAAARTRNRKAKIQLPYTPNPKIIKLT